MTILTKLKRKLFKIPRPFALEWDQWEVWERRVSKKYPIRYFLFDTLPLKLRIAWRVCIHEPWYYIKCAVWHKYNRVTAKTLPPTWCDRDQLLFHISFQILEDFIEREKPYEWFDTEESHHKEEWIKLRELYDWWLLRRNFYCGFPCLDHENCYENDTAKLHELIELRKLMWT